MSRVEIVTPRAAICGATVPFRASSGFINDRTAGANFPGVPASKRRSSMVSAPPRSKSVMACRTLTVMMLFA
jgi:hypothetical protein